MPVYRATVEKDGDDLVLVFPPEVLDALGAKIGDQVMWRVDKDGNITINLMSK